MTYVINGIFNDKSVDILVTICHMMIKAAFTDLATGSILVPILITKIMTKEKVPFKARVILCRCNPPITMDSISKMGLITKEGEKSNCTFKPYQSRSASANVHGTMMYLLNSLVSKVTKIIKN